MNTTKGSPLGTNKETARNLLDVRIILAVLWVAGMLSSLNGDTYRLNSAEASPDLSDLCKTPELLSVFAALVLVGHDFYECLDPDIEVSRELLGKPHHRHILCGVLFLLIGLWAFVSRSAGYELVWATGQLVFALLVVWYAWKWTNPEG